MSPIILFFFFLYVGAGDVYHAIIRCTQWFVGYLFEGPHKFGFSWKENLKFSLAKCLLKIIVTLKH